VRVGYQPNKPRYRIVQYVTSKHPDKGGTLPQEVTPITLTLPLNIATVSCYLVQTSSGFVLIDTGNPNRHAEIEHVLASAGCGPGDLKLILITHGDLDHIGSAVHLRDKFSSRIAMHRDDSGMAERGDMFSNRGKANVVTRILGPLVPILLGFSRSKRFAPDLFVEDGTDLSEHGIEATVLHIPGHSKGSIGVLTTDGDLFCGDLFENTAGPALNSIMDDLEAANESVERLKSLHISTVYPGHGQPFPMEQLMERHQQGASE
jgi:glyoxylase-like metal-dependent hydrolase (beta-lactamase superfamily II)